MFGNRGFLLDQRCSTTAATAAGLKRLQANFFIIYKNQCIRRKDKISILPILNMRAHGIVACRHILAPYLADRCRPDFIYESAMRVLMEKYRILVWIGILLLASFLTTSIGGYLASRKTVQHGIAGQVLPLASDSVYAALQVQVMRSTLLTSMMATDPMIPDWLATGETEPEVIVRYLAAIRQTHGAVSAFLVSDQTRKYYDADGIQKTMQQSDPQDAWFFARKAAKFPSATEIKLGQAQGNTMTVLSQQQLVRPDGTFLGLVGIGVKLETLETLLDSHERRFGTRVYFVDGKRRVALSGGAMKGFQGSVDALPGVGRIASQLLHGGTEPVSVSYERDGAKIFVNSRHIPELGWHLIVEHSAAEEFSLARNMLVLNLAAGAGITALVLGLLLLMVQRYHARLETMAGTDALTALMNRQAFDIVFNQAVRDVERTGTPLSGILFDIDYFRQVNELRGHLAGDAVLRSIARIAREALRDSDVVARWGGEEFSVLLKDCSLDQAAAVAEKLRAAIDSHDFSPAFPDRHITISLGVAQYEPGESPTDFFSRADYALYRAKTNGRNRLQVALIAEPPATSEVGAGKETV